MDEIFNLIESVYGGFPSYFCANIVDQDQTKAWYGLASNQQ